MAERTHGGYKGSESGEQKSSSDNPRRELGYSKDVDGQARSSSRAHNGDLRVRDRVRHKDIQERDSLNGDYRSSSSRSDSGTSGGGSSSRREYSVRIVDREPGELSSESGSDCAVESDLSVKDDMLSNLEKGTHSSPLTKRRKFSPIVWVKHDQQARGLSNGKTISASSSPMPPSLPRTDQSSRDAVLCSKDNLHVSPVNNNQEKSLSRVSEEPQPVDYLFSEASGSMHDQYSYGQRWGIAEEADKVEEEDYATTRNISSSRWAGDASSPPDEGEIFDHEGISKGRKVSGAKLLGTRLGKRSSSPELAEVRKGSSVEAQARSSGVEGGTYSRPSSGDHGSGSDLDGVDIMEVDNEHSNSGTSPGKSETDSEDNVHSPGTLEPPVPPQRTVNMIRGCRRVDEFIRLNKIDEGTYGVVYRARDNKTGEVVALKKVKMEKETEGFPLTSLREINILLSLHHPTIVDVKEVVVGSNLDSIFMVMEYMEHDLKALMETMKQPFSQSEVKCLMLQLLEGINYLHDNWVLHRDLKTSNLLLNNQGELKICDFGLARQYGSPLKPYTHLVVTLWYRAPELLLGAKKYSTAIDMWSLGCIMAELLSKEPLFNGKKEFDQLDKIFRVLGTPNEAIWPGFSKLPGVRVNFVKHQYNLLRKKFPATSFTGSPVLSDAGFDLLSKLLTYDPEKRITAEEALRHEWFREVPLPKSKEFMPTFPARNAQDRRTRRVMKSPDPLEEQRKREQHQAQFGTGGLFG